MDDVAIEGFFIHTLRNICPLMLSLKNSRDSNNRCLLWGTCLSPLKKHPAAYVCIEELVYPHSGGLTADVGLIELVYPHSRDIWRRRSAWRMFSKLSRNFPVSGACKGRKKDQPVNSQGLIIYSPASILSAMWHLGTVGGWQVSYLAVPTETNCGCGGSVRIIYI
jgi:hypothetical protein